MRFGKIIAGVFALCVSISGAPPSASALTFDEFDRLRSDQQENFIQTALHFYFFGFKNNPSMAPKATCMSRLNDVIVENGKSQLWVMVIQDIQSARNGAGRKSSVEGRIRSVIDRECPT